MIQEFIAYISIGTESHELDFVIDDAAYFKLKPYGIEAAQSLHFLIESISSVLSNDYDVNDYILHSIGNKPYKKLKSTSFDTLIAFCSYWSENKVDTSDFPAIPANMEIKSKLQLAEAINVTRSKRYAEAYNQYLIQSKLEKLTL